MKQFFIVLCIFFLSNSFTTLEDIKAPKSICIKGKVTNQGGVKNFDNLYVNIFWHGDDGPGSNPYFDETIQKIKKDGSFKFKTNAAIPDKSMIVFDEINFKMSIGFILVFEDVNGDKKCEFDEVVGFAPKHTLSYLEGNMEDLAKNIKTKYDKDLKTLLLLKEGFQLNKVVKTEDTFDDLQPDKKSRKKIEIIIPKTKKELRKLVPNWT